MKKIIWVVFILMMLPIVLMGGGSTADSERQDAEVVNRQQKIYQKVLPIPFFEYSIPRDAYIQIYEVVTTRAYITYTVIESMTGKTFFHGPSIGYGIPVDTSITNPLKKTNSSYAESSVIEQAEPNGLFSSKNTDGTWVLFVQNDGSVTPVYTEHKVTTFPFVVKKENDIWVRADNKPVDFTINVQ